VYTTTVHRLLPHNILWLQDCFPIKVLKFQIFQIDILKHPNINSQLIRPHRPRHGKKVDHNAIAARWTEFVRHPLVAKRVRAEMVIARMEYNFLPRWVNKKVTIASTDGAVATADFVNCEGWDVDGVSYFAAVAVCVVRRKVRRRVGATIDFRLLVFWLELLPIDMIQLQLPHVDILNQTDIDGHFIFFVEID